MSYISFSSLTQRVTISGRERAYAGSLVGGLASAATNTVLGENLGKFLNPKSPFAAQIRACSPYDPQRLELVRRAMSLPYGRDEPLLVKGGVALESFDYNLNTAITLGSDPIRLLARLHGQCEIHAWVAAEDRTWLAHVIRQGLESGVLRTYPAGTHYDGWQDVADMLCAERDLPVVTSYSITDGFPNPDAAIWDRPSTDGLDEDSADGLVEDAWADLTEEERWRAGMTYLSGPGRSLQMWPLEWDDYRFTHRQSAFTLAASEVG